LSSQVAAGAKLDQYKDKITEMLSRPKPVPGDPNYQEKMDAYNRDLTSFFKALPPDARDAAFKENPDAKAVYDQYQAQVQPARLDGPAAAAISNNAVAETAGKATVANGNDANILLSMKSKFTQCAIGTALDGKDEKACFADAPPGAVAAAPLTDLSKAIAGDSVKPAFNQSSLGQMPALSADIVKADPVIAVPAEDARRGMSLQMAR
jgi:hypothetical protein